MLRCTRAKEKSTLLRSCKCKYNYVRTSNVDTYIAFTGPNKVQKGSIDIGVS